MRYISGSLEIILEPDPASETIVAVLASGGSQMARVEGIDPVGRLGSEWAADAIDKAVRGRSAPGGALGIEIAKLANRGPSGWIVLGPSVEPEAQPEPAPVTVAAVDPLPEKKRRRSRKTKEA
jgi:hypothetical protein